MSKLEQEHKFYLSFENAICNDYVTEKFFKVLSHDMIPIVFGGTDYSSMAPPHSFINALDFDTVKELADYVKMLHENDAKFAEYFWWRDFYEVRTEQADGAQAFCDLCQALNNPHEPPKVYENLSAWWEEDSDCKKLDTVSLKHGGGEVKLLEYHF